MNTSLKAPSPGGVPGEGQGKVNNHDHYTTAHPTQKQIRDCLLSMGFMFELDHPGRKHPGLLVIREEQILHPGVRFPVMRAMLAEQGIITNALSDLCYLAAYDLATHDLAAEELTAKERGENGE